MAKTTLPSQKFERSVPMGYHTLFVSTRVDVKQDFFEQTIQDVKKALKPFSRDAKLADDVDHCDAIAVDIDWESWGTSGSIDGTPWAEAWDTPKLIQRMADVGFKISYFQNNPKTKKKAAGLSIGFVKKVPKNKQHVR